MARREEEVELMTMRISEEHDEKYPSARWLDSNSRHPRASYIIRYIYGIFKQVLFALIPSFLSPGYDLKFKDYQEGSTQWLDGLRGVASFVVFVSHVGAAYIPDSNYSWDSKRHPNLLFLPIFRVSYNGTAMVRIFFVVSGFALTYRAVKLTRMKGQQKKLLESLASSILRRYFRLFLPCFGSYILVHFARGAGYMDWFVHHHHQHKHDLAAVQSKSLPNKSSYGLIGQVPIMLHEFWRLAVGTTFLDQHYDHKTNPFLWTIPVEFHGSILLFVLAAGLSQVRRTIRVYVILPFLCVFYLYIRSEHSPVFIFGYLLAEIHAAKHDRSVLPTAATPQRRSLSSILSSSSKAKTMILYTMVVIGLWFLSFPMNDGNHSFSYVTICSTLLNGYSYRQMRMAMQNFGAMFLCSAMVYLPRMQKLFSTRLCQYLGRISFSLYLMHGLMLRTVGHRLVLGMWDHYPKATFNDRMFIAAVSFIFVLMPATVCMSDFFWRVCEDPVTNFVRRAEGWIVDKEEKPVQSVVRNENQHLVTPP